MYEECIISNTCNPTRSSYVTSFVSMFFATQIFFKARLRVWTTKGVQNILGYNHTINKRPPLWIWPSIKNHAYTIFKPKVLNWFQKSFNISSFFLQKCCSQGIVSRRKITLNAMGSNIWIWTTIIQVPCKVKRKSTGIKYPTNSTIQFMSSIILECSHQRDRKSVV